MPLIYIELSSSLDYIMPAQDSGRQPMTSIGLMRQLAIELPAMMMQRLKQLHLNQNTPETGIRVSVRQRDVDEFLVNGEDIWFRIYLSEEIPNMDRDLQKHFFAEMIDDWFAQRERIMPRDVMLDIFPGPTYGCGFVHGQRIEW